MGKKGFTLIEVLIVISIISILAAILLGYGRNSSRQIFLTSLITKTESLIANARASSIQTFFNDPSGIICAHGVKFDADDREAQIFQLRKEAGSGSCPDEDNIEDYSLEDPGSDMNVFFLEGSSNQLDFNSSQFVVGLDNSFYMIFVPPDPTIIINDSSDDKAELGIQVDNLSGSVTVTKYGQIDTKYFK